MAHAPVAPALRRYVAAVGGGAAAGGLASLVLAPTPAGCNTCKGRYPVCLCVTSCAACGHFNGLVHMRPTRAGFGASSGGGGGCRGCGLSEAEAYKFKAAASAHAKTNRARAAAAAQAAEAHAAARGTAEAAAAVSALAGSGQRRPTRAGALKPPEPLSSRERGLRILYPPQPLDLLRPPASQALDSSDPYADHFPF